MARKAPEGIKGTSIEYVKDGIENDGFEPSISPAEQRPRAAYFYYLDNTPANRERAKLFAKVAGRRRRIADQLGPIPIVLTTFQLLEEAPPRINDLSRAIHNDLVEIYRTTRGVLLYLSHRKITELGYIIHDDPETADVGGKIVKQITSDNPRFSVEMGARVELLGQYERQNKAAIKAIRRVFTVR